MQKKILSNSEFYLETERLIIRNWKEADRDLFHFINSDETVMAYFPTRRTRAESDELMDWLRASIDKRGFGFTAIEEKATGECIGFCGLHMCNLEPVLPDGTIEIGWRLAPQYWGKGYASESARHLLQFGFDRLMLNEIVSFAVEDNTRSLAVMKRIGMRHDPSRDFDHPNISDKQKHLRRHKLYFMQNHSK